MKSKTIYVSLLALMIIFALQAVSASDTDLNNDYSNDFNLGDSPTSNIGKISAESSIETYNEPSSSLSYSNSENEGGVLGQNLDALENGDLVSQKAEDIKSEDIVAQKDDDIKGEDIVAQNAVSSDEKNATKDLLRADLSGDNLLESGADSDNDSDADSKSVTTKIKTNLKVPVVYSSILKKTYLKIYLKDAKGKALANKALSVTVGKKTYKLTTNKKGFAQLYFPKKIGTYECTVKFKGTDEYYATSKDSKVKIYSKIPVKIKAPKIRLKSSQYANFTVKLTTPNGAPLKNKVVSVSIPAVKKVFKIKTNSKGIATLKFNGPKSYKVVVKFKGGKYYKSVSVKSKIIVKAVKVKFKNVVGAAVLLQKYIYKNKELPSKIKYKGKTYTTAQLSYLMAVAIRNIHKKNHKAITLLATVKPKATTGEIYDTVYKKNYLKIINKIIGSSINHKSPRSVKYSFYKIPYNVYVAGSAGMLSFYKTDKKLPLYCLYTKAYFTKVKKSDKYTFYLTSDNIAGKKKDLKMLKSLAKTLKSKGYQAVIVGIGPDIHNVAYRYGCTGKNSALLCVFGGVDVGCIEEWTGALVNEKRPFVKNYNKAHILALWFKKPYGAAVSVYKPVGRAWDADYGFALKNPAKYMSNHKISYMQARTVKEACKKLKAGKMGGPKLIK